MRGLAHIAVAAILLLQARLVLSAVDCEQINECNTCILYYGCGWCNGRCQSGQRTTECSTPWMYSVCSAPPPKFSETTAEDCITNHFNATAGSQSAGWCSHDATCYPSSSSVSDEYGLCPTATWYFFTPPDDSTGLPSRWHHQFLLYPTVVVVVTLVLMCGICLTCRACCLVGWGSWRVLRRVGAKGRHLNESIDINQPLLESAWE
ncbi:hypothetical protein J8273_8244 [Carpediemonas membranifera]|uniref:Uncharacterized protein n=1 Tax=Carpediemonas membranifera TaxID=201153 RepID=A0A8J6DXI3_9EUKA|nr:hypothetical protein J8273_8244 [Carpediemonas membranifera]|eukprot:KAG9390204.1 hypothetical protein J8273_8244 [Carpediemonas membranifera]